MTFLLLFSIDTTSDNVRSSANTAAASCAEPTVSAATNPTDVCYFGEKGGQVTAADSGDRFAILLQRQHATEGSIKRGRRNWCDQYRGQVLSFRCATWYRL